MTYTAVEGDSMAATFNRLDPVSGKVASTAAAMTVEEARHAADQAGRALEAWAQLGPVARRTVLMKAADLIEERASQFVDAMIAEIGATEGWARRNVVGGATQLREAAVLTTQITGDVIPSEKPGCLAMTIREPAGVVLGIAPWNAPIVLAVRAVAVALACGNTVLLKASETCPKTHGLIVTCLHDAGVPECAILLVTHAPADGAAVVGALIDHPAVRRINFTGSTHVGRIIAERAATQLKPVLLELGGKAPLVVLEDADLDEAVKAAAFGAFFNQGQICMSTERIIVVEAVADAFVEAFRTKVSGIATADPAQRSAPLGAVADRRTVEHIAALTQDARAAGAVVSIDGAVDGVLMSPSVVDRVTPDMRLFREESFGPVVGITRARDERHAVELANDTEFGLSASVFTLDIGRGLRVARQIKAGMCHINSATVGGEPHMPFGGLKASGYGRFGGKADIDFFTELRLITVATKPNAYPL